MPTYTDQLGREVFLENAPRRIVSLVPSQTELLFDLGLDAQIVGISNYCIHPKGRIRQKLREKTLVKIGGTKDFDVEKISLLNPDLIIANKEENDKERIRLLEKKFPVWISDVSDLQTAIEMIEQIGEVVGKHQKAQLIGTQLRDDFDDLTKQAFTLPIKCLYFIWEEPYMVAGSDSFISNMLELAGFQNVIDKNRYPSLTPEEIEALNPQLILLSSEPYPFKKKHIQEFEELVPKSKVRIVDGELFSWYGSRLLRSTSYFKGLRAEISTAFSLSPI